LYQHRCITTRDTRRPNANVKEKAERVEEKKDKRERKKTEPRKTTESQEKNKAFKGLTHQMQSEHFNYL